MSLSPTQRTWLYSWCAFMAMAAVGFATTNLGTKTAYLPIKAVECRVTQ